MAAEEATLGILETKSEVFILGYLWPDLQHGRCPIITEFFQNNVNRFLAEY